MSTYIKPDISGNPHSVKVEAEVESKTANYTVLVSDNGKTFDSSLDNMVFTLPPTQNGLRYRFVNKAAAGQAKMNISPDANDMIIGTFTLAASVVTLTGVDDTDIINTKVSETKANWVELTADGDAGWYITGSAGIWASA